MAATPPDPDALTRLQTALTRPGTDLDGALARLRTDPGIPPDQAEALTGLLTTLEMGLARDRLVTRARIQRLQFFQQEIRQQTEARATSGRLTGPSRALNLALAQAVNIAPGPLWGRIRRAMDAAPPITPPDLFDAGHYLAANPDVAAAGQDPLTHYVKSGAAEGRPPGPLPDDPAEPPRQLDALWNTPQPFFCAILPEALRNAALSAAGRAKERVSVVIPVLNRAFTVSAAIRSALLQSYPPHEVIVVDDGSTDGSADLVADHFAAAIAQGQLRLIRTRHGGVSAARNAGLAAASGTLIAYLDSDNDWEPDHLAYAAAALAGQPGAQAAYTGLARHNLTDGWSDVLYAPFDRAALETESTIDLNAFVHRRGLYEAQGGFDPALTRLVDWDLILRYTADIAPVAVPVITAHHHIEAALLANISVTEDLAPNRARIRAKLAGQA